MSKPRIAYIDIETSPNIVYRWDLRDTKPVPVNHIIEPQRILCFAAKEEGKLTEFASEWGSFDMHRELYNWLDWCDIMIGYNLDRFDVRRIKTELVKRGYKPPRPFKTVDLWKVSISEFDFPSSKLEHVAPTLNAGNKLKSGGMETFIGVMNGDKQAQEDIERYCRNDVDILPPLYETMKPWIKNHPSYAAYMNEVVCTRCGSADIKKDGFATLTTGIYQCYRCNNCGHWMRGTRAVSRVEIRSMS